MGDNGRDHIIHIRQIMNHFDGLLHVALHDLIFFVRKFSGLFKNALRNTDLTDIVQQSRHLHSLDIVPGQSQLLSQQHRILRDVGRMLEGKGILRIDGRHQGIHRRCHLLVTGLLILALLIDTAFIYLDSVLTITLRIKGRPLGLLEQFQRIRCQTGIPCHTNAECNGLHDLWFICSILLYCPGQFLRQCHQWFPAGLRHRDQKLIGSYPEYLSVLHIIQKSLRAPLQNPVAGLFSVQVIV